MDQRQCLLAGENGAHKDSSIDRDVDETMAKDGGQLIILRLFLGTGDLGCRKNADDTANSGAFIDNMLSFLKHEFRPSFPCWRRYGEQ